ncbi:hypothetical protein [Humibacillus xanthopallidus]|uniref:hypothetical protein n=1 Tax=Humibacillus xanthopallidus TaxID=412689 RepID=UPI00163A96DE|nr:hypothetical protein [Humibacillus xanthopallidus]
MLAQTPGIAVSTVVTAALAASLPGPLGWVVFLGVLSLALVLLAGAGEPAALRGLFGARALTPAEATALAPAIVLLCQRGLGPPLVCLYLWPGVRTVSAAGAGRRSVLVSAELVSQVRLGRLPPDQAAAVIAHAAGLVRVGALRSELGMQLWTIPWRLLRALARGVGAAGGRLPLVALMWRARFVVGLIALGQGVSAGQVEAVVAGALSAAVVGLSYLVPRWEKAWAAGLQALGDKQVARAGLAPALADFLLRQSRSAATFERVHALELAHASLQPPSPPVRSTRH